MMLQRRTPRALPTLFADPFRTMERFFDDDFFSPLLSGDRFFDRDRWLPAMDVEEKDEAFLATVELPGLSKDDVEVTVEDNVLTVSGERKWESEEGDETKNRFRRVERAYGKFSRSLTLPNTVKADDVKADFKDGVLHLTLPKAEESKAVRVDIH